jgi:type VI secretion system protein ImpE
MQAEQSLKDGDLQLALSQLQAQVRSNPAKVEYRVFLFQLLSVLGEWGRALTQLDVAGDLDASTLAMVQTYREALRCEVLRREVFAGKRSPLIFGDPEHWIALLLQSLQLSVDGQFAKAQVLREEAYEVVKTPTGSIDGQRFEWVADADPRIGPFLEAIVNGNYYWIPFHRIRRIQLDQPEDLRDMIWTPAQFTWANGGQAVGLIPTRYPESECAADTSLQLSRKTEWREMAEDEYHGIGQRILATDAGEYPLMDIRDIVIDVSVEEPDWSDAAGGQTEG